MNNFLLMSLSTLLSVVACKTETAEEAFKACEAAEKAYNDASEKDADKLFEDAKTAFAQFFAAHINTPFAQKIFAETRWVRRLNQNQLETVIGNVKDETFKQSADYLNAADRVKYMKASAVGNPFVNIVSRDTTGVEVQLSDIVGKGKYILIDFWASWCPDCRKEMPSLITLYDKFKGDKFDIVGYSLDRKAEVWKKGINDLLIPWPQMSDLEYWTSEGAKRYAVQWIPMTVLISPDGKIIARGLSVGELEEKLKGLLQ
ncbi:MAG: TlpA family protein disulfide reductase [Tannerella sp.]|jgi:thiol-disulfide isomerase/thioredoxin|nr:TlpA family protein disulfide reductase [Tannerella sp.]